MRLPLLFALACRLVADPLAARPDEMGGGASRCATLVDGPRFGTTIDFLAPAPSCACCLRACFASLFFEDLLLATS
ncbi:hypothetical protein PF010_g22156 [Phytophthora fragariae]|uniref:Secreted protein n=1 Tax=Phytophthora fragariae TaxID=53985 RepID=A0A6G0K9R1_9STRA|nr:hypothetical protein PF010_g22156 [Phytophthora fragariae]KAE9191940.1 hypothetical protein PF004_g21459 [Phytophthora fragariae]